MNKKLQQREPRNIRLRRSRGNRERERERERERVERRASGVKSLTSFAKQSGDGKRNVTSKKAEAVVPSAGLLRRLRLLAKTGLGRKDRLDSRLRGNDRVGAHRAWLLTSSSIAIICLAVGFGIGNNANSASPSDTSIPITKGGTSATTAEAALNNLLPSRIGNSGKVLGLSGVGGITPTWVEQDAGYGGMVPDYANGTILFSAPNTFFPTTWKTSNTTSGTEYTVTDDGFFYVQSYIPSFTGFGNFMVLVNDKTIRHMTLTSGNWESAFFAVKAGDKVQLSIWTSSGQTVEWHTGSSIMYFPPRAVAPPEINENYSTTEVDTGKTWVDGRKIYRQVFEGKITADLDTQIDVELGSATNISEIIDSGGWAAHSGTSANVQMTINSYFDGGAATFRTRIIRQTDGKIYLQSKSSLERADTPYKVWVEYTKI